MLRLAIANPDINYRASNIWVDSIRFSSIYEAIE